MTFSNATPPNATVHFIFCPLSHPAVLESSPRVYEESCMDQSVWLVNSFAVASSILSWMRKTIQTEGIFQNSCLGVLRRCRELKVMKGWPHNRQLEPCTPGQGPLLQYPGHLRPKQELGFSFIWLEFNVKIFCENLIISSPPH